MITVQVLQIIILACQVTGTVNGDFIPSKSYSSAFQDQVKCQKSIIKCVQEKDKKQRTGDSLTECLLER